MSRELNSINPPLARAINLSAFPYGLAKTAAALEPVGAASTASNDLSVCAAPRHRLALQVATRWRGSSSWLPGRRIVLSVTRSMRTNTRCRPNSGNSSVRRPCHIQHHEFRRNAPSQWPATRPNAAGHIEILSSLPNMPMCPTPLLWPWQQVLLVARTR
jgi:hypothetical protein